MLRVGLPQWHHRDWLNQLGGRGLRAYAKQFSTVEGGSTFYALPDVATVAMWKQDTPPDFRFCFKFPKTITHTKKLLGCDEELKAFFYRIAPLEERCGPFMIQLPPSFDKQGLGALESFIARLPADYHYGVEFRHRDYFDRDEIERAANRLLYRFGVERIWFDTRELFSVSAKTPEVVEAQSKKPNFPAFGYAITERPMVRLMSHADWRTATRTADLWANQLTKWIDEEQRQPYLFLHTPSNQFAPEFAGAMQDLVAAQSSVVERFKWQKGTTDRLI